MVNLKNITYVIISEHPAREFSCLNINQGVVESVPFAVWMLFASYFFFYLARVTTFRLRAPEREIYKPATHSILGKVVVKLGLDKIDKIDVSPFHVLGEICSKAALLRLLQVYLNLIALRLL